MGEGNREVSFACCGYGRGVHSPVAEVNVVAIQAQACKVVICPECIVTSQLRLRLSMPMFFSLLFRVIFPLSPSCFLGSFKLKCRSHVTYVHQENQRKPAKTNHGAQLHSSRSIINASPLKATLIDVFRQLTPQNRPHGFPRPPLIHPHLMVAQNHAVIPA